MNFEDEFKLLQARSVSLTARAGAHPSNVHKNRYGNVLAADATRVPLSEGGRYINANYVLGGLMIAAQGPLDSTVEDFWGMLWQERSSLVVMLCRTVENFRRKCHVYWPSLGKAVRMGQFTMATTKEMHLPGVGVLRSLVLSNVREGVSRNITHLQYSEWPDFGVPEGGAFADFLAVFAHYYAVARARGAGPPVVHCSAGIGRTGTFLSVWAALGSLQRGEAPLISSIVASLRSERSGMVQTPAQYAFIHEFVAAQPSARPASPPSALKHAAAQVQTVK